MTGRIAICCNGAVPGSGIPNGAQGLRAVGLQMGLEALGYSVDIVSQGNAIRHQAKRWNVDRVAIPHNWRIIDGPRFYSRLASDYETVVLLSPLAFSDFRKSEGTSLIYDFFSPMLVEHSFISSQSELRRKKEQESNLIRQSDKFIANGEWRARYGIDLLKALGLSASDVSVPSVRLAMPWCPPARRAAEPRKIFFGGFDQAWTRGLRHEDIRLLAAETGFHFDVIGVGEHLHLGERVSNGGAQESHGCTENAGRGTVTWHSVAPYEDYQSINRACSLSLDVFDFNEERRLSYSTRAITSMAHGCPIITMKFTEIGSMIEETNSGWTLATYSTEEVKKILIRISENPRELEEKSRNTSLFWERYCNPKAEIEPLASMIP